MGLFDKLFNKKAPQSNSGNFKIDIQGDCFIINGNRLEVPMHIDAFTAVLGTPRAVKFKTKQEDKDFLERVNHDVITGRVNYIWDELGLKAYTYNGSVVNTFSVELQTADYETAKTGTGTKFSGELTINGKPWLGVMLSGKDHEVFRRKVVGCFSLTAEYTDFMQDDHTRTEKDFTCIDISLGSENDAMFDDN